MLSYSSFFQLYPLRGTKSNDNKNSCLPLEFRLWWGKSPQSLQAYAYGSCAWIRCSQETMSLNIGHYPGQCICFTQEGFSAGATLVSRVSTCLGFGLTLLCLEMFMWLRQEPRGAAGWGGEGKTWSKSCLVDLFLVITSSSQVSPKEW